MSNDCLPVKRPVLPYFGGKWRIAPWVIDNLPPHKCYVEPFMGAASVLLRKPRCAGAEVLNDLDDEIVSLFKVLRDETRAGELIELLHRTPYALSEYLEAYVASNDAVEQARKTLLRFHAAFAADCMREGRMTGFKVSTDGQHPRSWANFPEHLRAVVSRLRGVIIENRDALSVIPRYDSPTTLYFVDPPYLAATRTSKRTYRHELTNQQHEQLAEVLHSVKGMVVLAGYPSPLYDRLYSGWECRTRKSMTCMNTERTEALWLSPNAQFTAAVNEKAITDV